MNINSFFKNVGWENGAIYNFEPNPKVGCSGCADVEVVEKVKNIQLELEVPHGEITTRI